MTTTPPAELPQTPGSTVTFDLPPDSDGTTYRAVVTLIVGHIGDDGTIHDAVWASAELDAPDDASCVFAPEVILSSRPEVVVETSPVDGFEGESIVETGTVIQVDEHGIPMTYTYAPSFIWESELMEHFWTNSYGGYWAYDENADVTVLFAPVHASS